MWLEIAARRDYLTTTSRQNHRGCRCRHLRLCNTLLHIVLYLSSPYKCSLILQFFIRKALAGKRNLVINRHHLIFMKPKHQIVISQIYAVRLNGAKGKPLECALRKTGAKRNSISFGILPSQEFTTSKGARTEPEKSSIATVVISDLGRGGGGDMLLLGNTGFGAYCCQR